MAKHIVGLYEITKEFEKDNNTEECYHRLANLCDSIVNIDEFKFDMDQFSLDEKKFFINKFIEILESNTPIVENIYTTQKIQKSPNKKLCYTLKKEDVDNSLDCLMKFFLKCGYDKCDSNSSFVPNLNISRHKLIESMDEETKYYRHIIRHTGYTEKEKFEKCYNQYMNKFNEDISIEIYNKNHGMYNLLEALFVLYKAMNSFADIYFQTVNYLIIGNSDFSKKDKLEKLRRLAEGAEKTEKEFSPRTNKAEKHNIFDAFAVYLMYLDYRNTCKNEISIQKLLTTQMEDEAYVKEIKDDYQCNQRWLEDIKTLRELRAIILEGKDEKEERFKKNMEDVQHLIVLLNTITGRELGAEYLQHVKVVYREIIEDEMKYNNKQARTIMRNIEKKEIPYFESERETYYIREKISRGLMREKGYVEEYILKNKLQAIFYTTVLKLFSSYDELRIARDARRLYGKYKRELMEVLE